jgi:hypothetical protein
MTRLAGKTESNKEIQNDLGSTLEIIFEVGSGRAYARLFGGERESPIWITSGLRTARELKHVHAEVAARLAEHLGEGGLTKGDLGCAPTDTPRPSQQACLPST